MRRKQPDVNRRQFLKHTATMSLGTVAAGAFAVPTATAQPTSMPPHGAELRGMSLPLKDPTAEGRFGFMFKAQTPFRPDQALLTNLGLAMEEQPGVGALNPETQVASTKDDNDASNENPNRRLTSGFTYVGQFVDHDITFDTTSPAAAAADPDATINFRTPRYDLDALYGGGPTATPEFYDPRDRAKFLVVANAFGVDDVPRRDDGTAIIADPRNDQHLIIVQLHLAFQKFHNRLVDDQRARGVPASTVFESARQLTRWHYQWMLIHDFLPRIVGQATVDAVYKEIADKPPAIDLKYYKPKNKDDRAFLPVEFTVAAFRFGHSITRPRYTIRDGVSGVPLFESTPTDNNLNGSRPIPAQLQLQWSKFFNVHEPGTPGYTPTARPVRQFDTRLATPLFHLPSDVVPDQNPLNLLAVRNLLRGHKLGLMTGQRVAQLMGFPVLTNAQLSQRHRTQVTIPIVNGTVEVVREVDEVDSELAPRLAALNYQAPLWFYILKEAEILGKGRQLGPVGGRIVAEVLVGLLKRDRSSYLALKPAWKPMAPIAPRRTAQGTPVFEMVDVLTYAGVWS